MNYILEGHTPVKCYSARRWYNWHQKNKREVVVAISRENGITIKTEFLGRDNTNDPPKLFSTFVYGESKYQERQWRYLTWEEAEEGHKYVCELVGLSSIIED